MEIHTIQNMEKQPIRNIGMLGMVADGKSTCVLRLTNTATQRHSKETKNNITIKIGYADTKIYKNDDNYITNGLNSELLGNDENELINHISLIDCPGHHELILAMLGSIKLMDGVIIIVSANEKISSKKSLIQHLRAVKLSKISKIIICLNKIDLIDDIKLVKQRYKELTNILKAMEIEISYPIIPTSLAKNIGTELLVHGIQEVFGNDPFVKERISNSPNVNDPEEIRKEYFMSNRSFDVNKPGTDIDDLCGAVIGGSLIGGSLSIGDEIEIRPGILRINKNGDRDYHQLTTHITSLKYGDNDLDHICPGGLTAIGTDIFPTIGKDNRLQGKLIGKKGVLPSVYCSIELDNINIECFESTWVPEVGKGLFLQVENQNVRAVIEEIKDNKNIVFKLIAEPVCIDKDTLVILVDKTTGTQIIGCGNFTNGFDKLE